MLENYPKSAIEKTEFKINGYGKEKDSRTLREKWVFGNKDGLGSPSGHLVNDCTCSIGTAMEPTGKKSQVKAA